MKNDSQVDKWSPLLLKQKIEEGDINHVSFYRDTSALIYAVKIEDDESVKVLMGKGADLSLKDTFGKTALDHAQQRNFDKIISALGMSKEVEQPEQEIDHS